MSNSNTFSAKCVNYLQIKYTFFFYFFQFNEFLKETGGANVSWSDWQEVGKLSLDFREGLIKTASIRRISGSVGSSLENIRLKAD